MGTQHDDLRRRLHRCIKVARTIADLTGAEAVATAHVSEALQLQRVLAI